MLKTTREAAAEDKVLIAGTGIESAIETLRLTEYAADLGYDVAMVRTPHYYKGQMEPANMLAFYRFVCDRSSTARSSSTTFRKPPDTTFRPKSLIELAEHPNLIGIKESSGDVEKVRKMVEGTRHVKRTATVTETFDAVTPTHAEGRELPVNGRAGNWCTVGVLSGARTEAVFVCRHRGREAEDAPEGSRLPGSGRRRAEAAAVAGSRSRRRHPCLRYARSDRLLRNLCRLERGRRRSRAREAGAHREGGRSASWASSASRASSTPWTSTATSAVRPAAVASPDGRLKAEIEHLLADIRN